jgi:Flp pilus assembly protein TadD
MTPPELRRAARDARARQDWAELLALAERLREESPDSPDGYTLGATALRRLRRAADMRALAAAGLARFPGNARLRTLAGDAAPPGIDPDTTRDTLAAAVKRQDWPAAEMLAAELRASNPEDASGYQAGSRALRERKKLRQADTLSHEGMRRFPDQPGMMLERAMLMHKLKRFDEAADLYGRLRALNPDLPLAWSRGATALMMHGRIDAAEALLAEGRDRFPDVLDLKLIQATCAGWRHDFTLARRICAEIAQTAPDDPRVKNLLGSFDLAERLQQADSETPSPDPEAPDEADNAPDPDDAGVLKRFESLGGNCEFGLVQRAAGIEPLGLLRFAAIDAENLATMLETGLDGVGAPETTSLTLNAHQEYMLEDTRYFRTHTCLNLGAEDPAILLEKLRRRTVFLRDKLLADLRAGQKLFLFRPAQGTLDAPTMRRLHHAVRSFGPGTLICVNNDPDPDRITVTRAETGLIVATMPENPAKLNLGAVEAKRYAPWLRLCRAVLEAVP